MTGHVRHEIHLADGKTCVAQQRVSHHHVKVEFWHDPVADSKPRLQPQHSRGRLSSMGSFRTLLIILWLALAAYTAVVISRHGLGLLPIFFGDMAKLGWPGQFNLDFLCFLILSALWTAWRNGFTAIALLLALIVRRCGFPASLPRLSHSS